MGYLARIGGGRAYGFFDLACRFCSIPWFIAFVLVASIGHADVTPTGAYASSVRINVPSYHSLEPQISLEYDSQSGNGFVGVGWSLRGLSSIRATSSTGGLPQGDQTDKYWLDGNELIPCRGAPAGSPVAASPSCKYPPNTRFFISYTTHAETFKRIGFQPGRSGGRWHVWEKNGTEKIYAPARDTAQWNISETTDVLGNTVRYSYTDSAIGMSPDYLDSVTYNQTRIQLYWEPRNDAINMAAKGGFAKMTQRLKTIDVLVEGKRQAAYALSYHYSGGTRRSMIDTIRQYGTSATVDASGTVSGTALPATTVAYQEQASSSSWHSAKGPDVALPAVTSPMLLNRYTYEAAAVEKGVSMQFLVGDFDGDGRSDALVVSVLEDPSVAQFFGDISTPQSATLKTHVRLASQKWVEGSIPFTAAAHWGDVSARVDGRAELVQAWVADVNGDGFDDLILMSWAPAVPGDLYGALTLQLNAALSNGDGTFRLATPQFATSPWKTAGVTGAIPINFFPPDTPVCTPGDFTGDGRADFACMFQDSISKQFLGVAYATTAGSFSFQPVTQIADDAGTIVQMPGFSAPQAFPYETRRIAAGDFNNDGQTDLVILDLNADDVSACAALGDPTTNRPNCLIRYDLLTLISRGDGFDQQRTSTFWVRADYLSESPGTLATADLDGDGRSDVIFVAGTVLTERFQTIKLIRSALSRRDGSYEFHEQPLRSAGANRGRIHLRGCQRRRPRRPYGRHTGRSRRRPLMLAGTVQTGCPHDTSRKAGRHVRPACAMGRLQRVDGSQGQLGAMAHCMGERQSGFSAAAANGVRNRPAPGRRFQRRRLRRLHAAVDYRHEPDPDPVCGIRSRCSTGSDHGSPLGRDGSEWRRKVGFRRYPATDR